MKTAHTKDGKVEYVLGEVVIRFKEGTSDDQMKDVLAANGLTVIQDLKIASNIYLLKVTEGQEEAVVAKVGTESCVDWIEISHAGLAQR